MGATVLIPARLAGWQKSALETLRSRLPDDPDVTWFFSSGTQSVNRIKCIGLRKSAILVSAAAVNKHLDVTPTDIWSLEIPAYHIGGYALLQRAELLGCKVVRAMAWEPNEFVSRVNREKVTLTSLVPTQVYDLVAAGLTSPPSLRAAVIGGGRLETDLYFKGRELGWPLLPSYGLTECASQVATARLESLYESGFPGLTLLPHVNVELRDSRIFIRTPAVCQWIATADAEGLFTLEDPLRDGWLPTEDLGEWVDGPVPALKILGRSDDVVKVFGVLVSLVQVESDLRATCRRFNCEADFTVCSIERGREGTRILAVTDCRDSLKALDSAIAKYNAGVPGPFRVQQLYWTERIPRTALGKVRKAQLKSILNLT